MEARTLSVLRRRVGVVKGVRNLMRWTSPGRRVPTLSRSRDEDQQL
jgi:hypothetical protein